MNGVAASTQTLDVASGTSSTGAQVVNLLSGATPGANTTLNIMCGAGTAGTQTFNLLATGATRAGAVNISTGAAAHVTTIGNVTSSSTVTIKSGDTSTGTVLAGAVGAPILIGATAQTGADFRLFNSR